MNLLSVICIALCFAVEISVVLYHTMIPGFGQFDDWNDMTCDTLMALDSSIKTV